MTATRSRYLSFVEIAAAALLLAYPAAMLVVKGGMNGAFLLMLMLAAAVAIVRPAGMERTVWRREWTIYALSMLSMSAALFLSQSFHRNYFPHPYDGASRYWLAIPVFLLLRRLDPKVFAALQFAFPLAAIAGYLMARDLGGRWGIDTLDLIHFGDFELMLGVLSLFSIDWLRRDKLAVRALKIIGFMAGFAASFATGSRGGWLAIPVFVLIYLFFRARKFSMRNMIAALFAALLSVVLLYFLNANFHQRANDLRNDIAVFDQGNKDTSTGIRWQLYKAAADVFSRNPVFGVGPDGFALEMAPMAAAGKITPAAAELGRGEVHNDILCKAAGMGIFGLAAMMSVYVVPFWLFRKATASPLIQVRRSGVLGIAFVSGFFIFGLTVEILNLTMAIAFYSFTVAALLAACYNTRHKAQAAPR